MSPYAIGVLVHYYGRCEDHPDIIRNPPVWRMTIDMFKDEGLLMDAQEWGMTYALTPRGRAWVDAIQLVPLPVQVWVIPEVQAASCESAATHDGQTLSLLDGDL